MSRYILFIVHYVQILVKTASATLHSISFPCVCLVSIEIVPPGENWLATASQIVLWSIFTVLTHSAGPFVPLPTRLGSDLHGDGERGRRRERGKNAGDKNTKRHEVNWSAGVLIDWLKVWTLWVEQWDQRMPSHTATDGEQLSMDAVYWIEQIPIMKPSMTGESKNIFPTISEMGWQCWLQLVWKISKRRQVKIVYMWN